MIFISPREKVRLIRFSNTPFSWKINGIYCPRSKGKAIRITRIKFRNSFNNKWNSNLAPIGKRVVDNSLLLVSLKTRPLGSNPSFLRDPLPKNSTRSWFRALRLSKVMALSLRRDSTRTIGTPHQKWPLIRDKLSAACSRLGKRPSNCRQRSSHTRAQSNRTMSK